MGLTLTLLYWHTTAQSNSFTQPHSHTYDFNFCLQNYLAVSYAAALKHIHICLSKHQAHNAFFVRLCSSSDRLAMLNLARTHVGWEISLFSRRQCIWIWVISMVIVRQKSCLRRSSSQRRNSLKHSIKPTQGFVCVCAENPLAFFHLIKPPCVCFLSVSLLRRGTFKHFFILAPLLLSDKHWNLFNFLLPHAIFLGTRRILLTSHPPRYRFLYLLHC